MNTCTQCGKPYPAGENFCYCRDGFEISHLNAAARKPFWQKIPSVGWLLIVLAAIAICMIIVIWGFVALATVEAAASVLFLVIGCFSFRVFSGRPPVHSLFLRAIGIGFFALMGATVDQTGNAIYNQPLEWCYCGEGGSLVRATDISNPLPGQTNITQDFTCWKDGNAVKSIHPLAVTGIRFLEYVLLAYGLLGLRWVGWRMKRSKPLSSFKVHFY